MTLPGLLLVAAGPGRLSTSWPRLGLSSVVPSGCIVGWAFAFSSSFVYFRWLATRSRISA